MSGLAQKRRLGGIGALLAMLAICLHLALSFSHSHPREASGSMAQRAADGTVPASPLDSDADDGCAICANIAAFASLDLPTPVILTLLLLPVAFALSWQGISLLPSQRYRLFHGRAPPLL